jgi:hypothetical protein
MDRRRLLTGLAMLPVIGVPAAGLSRPDMADGSDLRLVADTRLPGARALAAAAREQGLPFIDPRGEIVAHFLGEGADWLRASGPIVGLTSYTDMMLMRDVAREAGRSLRYAAARGQARPLVDRLEPGQSKFVASLRDAPVSRGQARAFIWLV